MLAKAFYEEMQAPVPPHTLGADANSDDYPVGPFQAEVHGSHTTVVHVELH